MLSTAAPVQRGLYLYGITIADNAARLASGVAGAEVEPIVEGRLEAVVSRLAMGKLRPQRAHLAAHHRVLHDVAEERPVLPVVFGTVTRNETDLRRLLRRNHDALLGLLERLRGRVEMGLKVYWDIPNVFEYFVATNQELEGLRNKLFRSGRAPTIDEKIAVGERFASLLQQARARHTQRVREAIAPCSVEVRVIDPGEERMIMKLACLVEKQRIEQWEEGVRQAAALFDDHYRFDYNGPWPAYNFVDVNLKWN